MDAVEGAEKAAWGGLLGGKKTRKMDGLRKIATGTASQKNKARCSSLSSQSHASVGTCARIPT